MGSPERGRQTGEGWENKPFANFKRQYLKKVVDTSKVTSLLVITD